MQVMLFIKMVEVIHNGYTIYMGSNCSYVLVKSCKQKSGGTSIPLQMYAEIIALVDSLKIATWLKNILTSFDISPIHYVSIAQDNQSGMKIVNDVSKCKRRSKHILAKLNYAKDLVNSGIIIYISEYPRDVGRLINKAVNR